MRRPAEFLAAVVLLLALAGQCVADVYAPAPFKAVYAAALNGMPLGFDVRMELAAAGPDTWDFSLAAGSSMLNYNEKSHFRWNDCVAEPRQYRYEFRGFGIDRKLWLDFDHNGHVARGESRRGPVSFPFPPDASDELGLSLSARCQLLKGAKEVTFNVATTTGMKQMTYRIDGREVVKTPFGKFETVRIVRVRKAGEKRRSVLWVAPALGYTMVKMEHVEKLGVRGMVTLKSLEGISPAGSVTPSAK